MQRTNPGVASGQIAVHPHIEWRKLHHVATTSEPLMNHVDSSLLSMMLCGPDMSISPLLLTIKLFPCQSITLNAGPSTRPTVYFTARCSMLRSSSIAEFPFLVLPGQIIYHLPVSLLFVSKCHYKPSETSAAFLSLSPSLCLQTSTLSWHLLWR